MRGGLPLILLLCACKAQIGDSELFASDGATPTDAEVEIDAPPDAAPLGPWGPPAKIPGASSATPEDDGTLSASGLELVFALADPNDGGRKHLYSMTRSSPQSTAWSAPVRLPFAVNGTTEQTPRFSADDLSLYFASNRTGTTGGLDIWKVTRSAAGGAWPTTVALVPGINSSRDEKWLALCDGDRYLMISARGGASEDIYEGALGAGAPVLVGALSSGDSETGTFLTKDCLTAYFASTRSGSNKIYRATRTTPTGGWTAPARFDEFAALGGNQEDPWLSADQRTFVFASDASGNKDLYISTR